MDRIRPVNDTLLRITHRDDEPIAIGLSYEHFEDEKHYVNWADVGPLENGGVEFHASLADPRGSDLQVRIFRLDGKLMIKISTNSYLERMNPIITENVNQREVLWR